MRGSARLARKVIECDRIFLGLRQIHQHFRMTCQGKQRIAQLKPDVVRSLLSANFVGKVIKRLQRLSAMGHRDLARKLR